MSLVLFHFNITVLSNQIELNSQKKIRNITNYYDNNDFYSLLNLHRWMNGRLIACSDGNKREQSDYKFQGFYCIKERIISPNM